MNFNLNSSVLEAFEELDKLNEEPSAPFKAIYAGSKFVPDEARQKLKSEAFADYDENMKKFKADIEALSGAEEEQVDEIVYHRFNEEKSTIGFTSDDHYMCRVCYYEEKQSDRGWSYTCCHFLAGVLIHLEIDGVPYRDYQSKESGKHFRGLHDVMEAEPGAKAAVKKACAEAEAKLLSIARKYFPDAEVKPTRIYINTDTDMMIELDFTKAYEAAEKAYQNLIADYEVSEAELQTEEEQIGRAHV